jgi:hypothetical protein
VAKSRKTGGKDFKPGNPGGPGRPELPPALKEARRLNKTEFELVVNKYLWCSLEELEKLAKEKSLPVMEAWIVSIMARGVSTGDWGGNEWIAQRLMGKVKDQVELTMPKPFVVRHLDGSATVLGTKIEKDDET